MLLTKVNENDQKTLVCDSAEGPGQRGSFDFTILMRHFVSGGSLRTSAIGTSRSCCMELEFFDVHRNDKLSCSTIGERLLIPW